MSMHPNFSRNGSHPRQFYPSPPSMHTSDSGYGSTRGEMGPPSLDFPPQPIEIDLSNSRTLPSPSPSSSVAWETTLFSSHGFSDISSPYGPISRIQQLPMDRTTGQAPLLQWYADNDGPWYPKTISDPISEERTNSKFRSSNRAPVAFGGPYRQQDSLENGSFHFGAPPQSDSGYGTRRSIGNASIFSADVNDRDQDCQSLAGHVADYQPFQGLNEALQSRENRTADPWPPNLPTSINSPGFLCRTCQKSVKTKSELKKHDLRHKKPFVCSYPGCVRTEGFSTTNDLDRHTKSKHYLATTLKPESMKRYRCVVPGCKSKDKAWPRLDNFRSHLRRVHGSYIQSEAEFCETIRLGEFFEQSGLNQGASLSADVPTQRTSQTMEANESPPKPQEIKTNWKPVYPDLIQDLVTPMDTPMDKPFVDSNVRSNTILGPNNSSTDSHARDTIKPSELIRNPIEAIHKIPLESVLSTPVGMKSALNGNLDHVSRPSMERNPLPSADKATRHSVSATDATITEVIRIALAEAKNTSNVGALPIERKVLPNGKSSSAEIWGSTTDRDACFVDEFKETISSTKDDSLEREKAVEVFKTLQKLGYIIQKNPNHTPRVHNTGSAASHKSDNQVTCQICKKFKGRPCELKKHMKRHERPYGCTFLTCNKTFGSKNDWKRHENSQHFHLETWRCDKEKPEGGTCAKVSYRRQLFQDHLKKDHDMSDEDAVKIRAEACRIGRNCQARFWCGFCKKLIDLKKKGLDAWAERFDHIDDHFMGRREIQKQGIQEWVPIGSDRPKGDIASPKSLHGFSTKDGHEGSSTDSTNGSDRSSPESIGSTGASYVLIRPEAATSKKRECSDDESARPKKHTKRTEIVYCCQCTDDPGRTLTLSPKCTSCNHHYCNDCKKDSICN